MKRGFVIRSTGINSLLQKTQICLFVQEMALLTNLLLAVFIHAVLSTDPIHNVTAGKKGMPFANYYPPKYYMKEQTPCGVFN